MRKILQLFIAAFLTVSCLSLTAQATPPTYGGTTFNSLQAATDDASLFFGVIVALAIVVTGFFLGRRWLRRVG